MSLLITTDTLAANNGYMHLTTDTRSVEQLSTGVTDSTVLHTKGANMFEVAHLSTFSLEGGTDLVIGTTWLTGDYCRNARTIPGVTLSGSPGAFVLYSGEQVVFDLLQISGAYVYDSVSDEGCSATGYPLYVLEAGSTKQLYTGNSYACGLGVVYYNSTWTPVVTFNTTNTTAATMWNNRSSVQIAMYITNGIVDTSTSSLNIAPIYNGYDVEIGNSDIRVNNTSIFNRMFLSCSYANNYFKNNAAMNPSFDVTYDAYAIYNASFLKTAIDSVYIAKNAIYGYDSGNALVQYFGGDTSLHYESIVMLNKGDSYTLQADAACFALLCTWDSNQPGLSFRKIHTAMADGNYYLLLGYLLAGSIFTNTTWLTKSGNTLTLNSNISSAKCALVAYNP